jgi:hypothetical protein
MAGMSRRLLRHHPSARSALVLLLVPLVLFATGCRAEMGVETVVMSDGSGTIALRVGADRQMLELLQEEADQDPFAPLRDEFGREWRLDEGEEADGSRWFRAERSFADAEEFAELARRMEEEDGGPALLSQPSLLHEQGLFTVRTAYAARIDLSGLLTEIGDDAPLEPEELDPALLGSFVVLENRLTLPGAITSHNGDALEGNTVVWRPGFAAAREMQAESVSYRWSTIVPFALTAGVLLLVLAVTAARLLARRGSRESPDADRAAAQAGEDA